MSKTLRLHPIIIGSFLSLLAGCKIEEPPPPPSTCDTYVKTSFGTGSIALKAPALGDTLTFTGDYTTSSQFLSDTLASHGAGGFVHDTVVASKPLRGMVVGYLHSPRSGYVYERIIVCELFGAAAGLQPGMYTFSRIGGTPSGNYAQVHFFFSDSVHPFSFFDAKSGSLVLISIDTCAHRIRGVFGGTVADPSDTTKVIQLTGGQFDILYTDHYFSF